MLRVLKRVVTIRRFFWVYKHMFDLIAKLIITFLAQIFCLSGPTVLSAKSDSDFMFCLQSYQGFIIDRSLVYKSYP